MRHPVHVHSWKNTDMISRLMTEAGYPVLKPLVKALRNNVYIGKQKQKLWCQLIGDAIKTLPKDEQETIIYTEEDKINETMVL